MSEVGPGNETTLDTNLPSLSMWIQYLTFTLIPIEDDEIPKFSWLSNVILNPSRPPSLLSKSCKSRLRVRSPVSFVGFVDGWCFWAQPLPHAAQQLPLNSSSWPRLLGHSPRGPAPRHYRYYFCCTNIFVSIKIKLQIWKQIRTDLIQTRNSDSDQDPGFPEEKLKKTSAFHPWLTYTLQKKPPALQCFGSGA